ncbi:hypothetical protein AMECASPLE_010253 [Ameca splendens]|uniref:Uncharacterized protein n=1 Tax=Ameca splendens TaxID=208324 RepID=A0ABV0XPG9_9TELE
MVPVSSGHWARGRVHPGQVSYPSQGNSETQRTTRNTHAPTREFREFFWDFWRKTEYPERSPTCTERTYKLHEEGPQAGDGSEPRTFLLQGNSATNFHHSTQSH